MDLAHLLAKHGERVTFLTTAPGAPNPAYATELFYKFNLSDDTARVTRLFEEAPAAGINLQQCSLSWQALRDHITGARSAAESGG